MVKGANPGEHHGMQPKGGDSDSPHIHLQHRFVSEHSERMRKDKDPGRGRGHWVRLQKSCLGTTWGKVRISFEKLVRP
jgi:hypothetical protein